MRRTGLTMILFAALRLGAHGAAPAENEALLGELTTRDPELLQLRQENTPERRLVGLVGNLADGQPGAHAATAKAFIEKYGVLFGCPPGGRMPPDLEVIRDQAAGKGHKLVMVPARNGVPFLSGSFSFTFDEAGKLVGASGGYVDLASARMGSMDAAAAAKQALRLLSGKVKNAYLSGDGAVREYISSRGGGLEHVYDVTLTLGEGRHPWFAVLGPGGELLRHGSAAAGFNGSGNAFPTYPDNTMNKVDLTDLVDPRNGMVPKPLVGTYFYPESSAPIHAVSRTGEFKYLPRLGQEIGLDMLFYDPRFLEVNVYYHLMKARKHAIDSAEVTEVDHDKPMRFNVWEYPDRTNPRSYNNAYYSSPSKDMHFPLYNPDIPMDPPLWRTGAVDASVIYHEYGHHVMASFGYDIGNSASWVDEFYEAQSIQEGYADYFAHTLTGATTLANIFLKNARYPDGRPATRDVPTPGVKHCGFASIPMEDYYEKSKLFSTTCYDLRPILGDLTLKYVTKACRTSIPLTYEKWATELVQVVRAETSQAAAKEVKKSLEAHELWTCRLENVEWPSQ